MSIAGKTADYREMVINLEVWDLKHLNSIISQLKTKPVISAVQRVNG
jgi:(p)ppGpp synthase/HD superfamily hydrolase